MCIKAVDTCPFVFNSATDQFKTKQISDKAVCNGPFMLK